MLKISEPINVTCPKGHAFPVEADAWERQEREVDEKPDSGMGNAICHPFRWNGVCPACGEEIEANIDAWEYPEGTLETCTTSHNVSEEEVAKAFVSELD